MKKNLIFLSGVDSSDNKKALLYIKEQYPKHKKVCFIPAEPTGAEKEFKQISKDFKKKLKVREVAFLPLEKDKSSVLKTKIKKADILFLGGGNTFYFYNMILKKQLKSAFKAHLKKGGLIIGLSAGAILLSPSLLMACFPSEEADEYSVKLKTFDGMNLVPFELCPHYKNSKKTNKDLMTYSSLHKNALYTIKDGDFIAVNDKGTYFSGSTKLFLRGEKVKFI